MSVHILESKHRARKFYNIWACGTATDSICSRGILIGHGIIILVVGTWYTAI